VSTEFQQQAEDAATTEFPGSAPRFAGPPSGERCVNCQAPLASDQRYCVNCGERRGRARFSSESAALPTAPMAAASAVPDHQPSRGRRGWNSSATLLVGILTLLVALGVGVLIGHQGRTNSSAPAAAQQPSIVVNGGGSGGGGSSGSSSTSGGTKAKAAKAKHAAAKNSTPKAAKVSKKVQAKAAAAATKVTGGSAKIAAPTTQQGGSCQNGQAGCQGGKLTGNFFGN
jgi:hypothetical protein